MTVENNHEWSLPTEDVVWTRPWQAGKDKPLRLLMVVQVQPEVFQASVHDGSQPGVLWIGMSGALWHAKDKAEEAAKALDEEP